MPDFNMTCARRINQYRHYGCLFSVYVVISYGVVVYVASLPMRQGTQAGRRRVGRSSDEDADRGDDDFDDDDDDAGHDGGGAGGRGGRGRDGAAFYRQLHRVDRSYDRMIRQASARPSPSDVGAAVAAVDRDYDDARREWPQSAAVGGLERKMRAFERQCEARAHEWAVAEAERIKVAAVNKARAEERAR